MKAIYKIESSCLRYVVPFKYREPFEEAFQKVEDQKEEIRKQGKASGNYRKIWHKKLISRNSSESDLYEYIKDEFHFCSEEDEVATKVGCEWLFWRSKEEKEKKDGKPIKEVVYYPNGISKENTELPNGWNISFTNVGLVLFRNGMGFIWYEIDFSKTEINSEQLKEFQNAIRELNRGKATQLWEKTNIEPEYGMLLSKNQDHRKYISPFFIGIWLQDFLDFLNPKYFEERDAAYKSMLENSLKSIAGISVEKVGADKQYKEKYQTAPDKALLFTYAVLENYDKKDSSDNQEKSRNTLSYCLTNGYKDSYHFSEDIISEMKEPFQGVLWYATQEGVSYLSWPSSDNRKTFLSYIPSKICTDYFLLYLKTLYQSFSLLLFAERIQSEILYKKDAHLTILSDKNIQKIYGEINLFLTKSMATSVSHIHHQSEFYVYLNKQLRIQEDVASVTVGLKALEALQREQFNYEEKKECEEREEREQRREETTQAIMGLFTLLGIVSVAVDTMEWFAKAADGEMVYHIMACLPWSIFLLAVIAAVCALSLVVGLWTVGRAMLKWIKWRKEQ